MSITFSKRHPTLPILCNAETGEVCRISGKTAGQWTKGSLSKRGYFKFRVGDKTYWVHRLIAETFISNPEHKPYVDHINRKTYDNRVSNLRWVTPRENSLNSSRVDLSMVKYGVSRSETPKAYYKIYDTVHKEYRKEWHKKHREYLKWMANQCRVHHW